MMMLLRFGCLVFCCAEFASAHRQLEDQIVDPMGDEVLMEVQLLQTKQKVGRKALNKHDPMATSADAVALDDKEDIVSNHGVASNTATITAKTDVLAFAEANSSVAVAAAQMQQDCAESLLDAGWGCYDDVMWAKNTGIHQHPHWYSHSGFRLTASDSIQEFHTFMAILPLCSDGHEPPCANHRCLYPCFSYMSESTTCSVSLTMAEPSDQYNACYGDLGFEATLGACEPDGRGGANMVSTGYDADPCPSPSGTISVMHFPNLDCTGQHDGSYTAMMDGMCMENCCNQDASRCDLSCQARTSSSTCGHASPGTDCADQLRWAMTEGIHNHPEWYTGLTAHSSVRDFQRYVSTLPSCRWSNPPCYGANDACPTPCQTSTPTTTQITDSYGWNTGSYGW